LAALVLAAGSCLAQPEFPKQPGLKASHGISLIPEPQLVRVTGDDFRLEAGASVELDSQVADLPAVASLREGVARIARVELKRSEPQAAAASIVLRLVPESALEGIPEGDARREGYVLRISSRQVRIEAAHPAGLFYGVQTFLQLLEQGKGRARGVRITDWPDMPFRAVHVCLWYHLDRPWYYEYLFRQLAHYKINAAVFEFEDKFYYTRHPVLSAPRALTAADVKRLVESAQRYHIQLVPLVQTLGHVSFIAKHPEYAPLREAPMSSWQLCPLKKGTFELTGDILDEMIEATRPSKYFHIGGDEARELGMGAECRQKWGDRAAVESYRLWLEFVCGRLKSRGLTAIVWDDMFLRHFSEADMTGLPDNLIYMRWEYDAGEFRERDKKIVKLGYPVWIATAAQTMTPIFPDQRRRVYNNANFIPSAATLGVKGVLNTAWEDAGVHPETYWMGFLASAEYSWSSKTPPAAEFRDKFFELFYGADGGLSKVYEILSEPGFVRRESSWTRPFEALDLPPIPDTNFRVADSWLEKNRGLVEEAGKRRAKFQEAVRILTENLAGEAKNPFNLEVLLMCTRTLLHFSDLILGIAEINAELVAAQDDHQRGQDASAIGRYQRASRILEDLRYSRASVYDETVRVWEKSTYPKDFRDLPGGRERFVHQVDRDLYYANKTMDLSYIFEVEDKLGLIAYRQRLQAVMVRILRGSRPW
jgi:hypothetical protein